jgi:hypothetical protein
VEDVKGNPVELLYHGTKGGRVSPRASTLRPILSIATSIESSVIHDKVTWNRLQLAHATTHDATQPERKRYFHIIVEVSAKSDEDTTVPDWVCAGRRRSRRLVIKRRPTQELERYSEQDDVKWATDPLTELPHVTSKSPPWSRNFFLDRLDRYPPCLLRSSYTTSNTATVT